MSGPDAVEFVVKGWPPKKSEAKSLFAANHPKADRVKVLLEAVRAVARRDLWNLSTGQIALELTIHCPGRPDGDATNFLGGVADVLQGTTPPNVDVTHLEDLAALGLYADDRQISRISYCELPSAEVSYRVRVSIIR